MEWWSTGLLSGTKETLLVCVGLEIQKPKQSESWHSEQMSRVGRQAYRNSPVEEGMLSELLSTAWWGEDLVIIDVDKAEVLKGVF